MEPVFAYFIKMFICSALLLGYYWLALRNERFHQWNRFYLMAAMLLSIVVPFFQLPIMAQEEPTMVVTMVSALPWNMVVKADAFQFGWKDAMLFTGIVVSAAMLLHLVVSLLRIYRMYRRYEHSSFHDVSVVITEDQTAPFSFFKWLFWRQDIDPDSENGKRMLQHELTHISEKHSTDKLFTELVLIVFWMNPFFWIIRRELFAIHEFLADQKAIQQYDGAAFAAMILQAVNPSSTPALSNPFFTSQLKRRLVMITTSHAPKYSYLRRISGFVLMVTTTLLLILTIEKVQAQKTPKPEKPAKLAAPVPDAPPVPAVHPLPDSIRSVTVWDNNGDCMLTYQMKDGRTIKMKMTDAKKNGYPMAVPPPPAPPAAASGLAPIQQEQAVPPVLPPANPELYLKADELVYHKGVEKPGDQTNANNAEPLYVYAGIVISKEQMEQIDPNNIYKIDVLKGESAIKVYGDKGKNGVVKITPKNMDYSQQNDQVKTGNGEVTVKGYSIRPDKTNSAPDNGVITVRGYKQTPPIYILDGNRISEAEMKTIQPSDIESMSVLKGQSAIDKYGQDAKDGAIEIIMKDSKGPKGPKAEKGEKGPKNLVVYDKVFTKAEIMPSFPGGSEGWRNYLRKNLEYPLPARENKTKGTVEVEFIVHEDGSISNVKANNDPGSGLAEEAVRIIKGSPKWNPAMQNGRKVPSVMKLPITFSLG